MISAAVQSDQRCIVGQIERCQLIVCAVQKGQRFVFAQVEGGQLTVAAVQFCQCHIFGEAERCQRMEGTYEFSEVFEIFDALKGFDSGSVGRFFPAQVDDEYGVRFLTADFPVAVGVEII